MLENPYEPPKVALHQAETDEASPRKRFRFRVIPATLCFTFGGIGVVGWVFQAVSLAVLFVRAGRERFNIEAMVIILAGQLACFSLFVLGGWLWLRGRWIRAVAVIVAAYGLGVAAFTGGRFGNDRNGRSAGFVDQIIKPPPPGNRKGVDRRAPIADEIGSTTSPRRPTQVETPQR